jgi:ADP-ribose pyrophosphatase YjhB (NUDIX family)
LKNYPIRTSAKAIIISNDRLLTVKYEQNNEKYFTLPGGGQNHNEDLKSALIRECLEEIGRATSFNCKNIDKIANN